MKKNSLRVELFWVLVAALAGVAVCAGIYLLNPRYFYIDDRTAMFVPVFLDIGRMLHHGVFPWMSLGSFAAGNYLMEYQFGIFNPLCLFTMWLAPLWDNQAFVHALIAAVYVFFTSVAAYLLGRALRLPPAASALLAFVTATNPSHMVWNLSAWIPAAPGLCFMLLALAATVFYVRRPSTLSLVGLALSVYLLVTAGWPQSIVFYGLAVSLLALIILVQARFQQAALYRVLGLGAGVLAGIFLASIAVMALLASSPFTERAPNVFSNTQEFCAGTLRGLFMASFPYFNEFFNSWGGFRLQPLPHFYAAWFILPGLILLDWSQVKWRTAGSFLVAITLAAALLSLGPERLGPLRFPIRFVAYYHIFLAFTVVWLVVTHRAALVFSQKRLIIIMALLAGMGVMAWQNLPTQMKQPGAAVLVSAALTLLAVYAARREKEKLLYATLGVGTFAMLVWLFLPLPLGLYALQSPGPKGIAPFARGKDWATPESASAFPNLARSPNRNTLFFGHYMPDRPAAAHYAFRPASLGMMNDMRSFNGYTSIGHRGLSQWFDMSDHGNLHLRHDYNVSHIFERDAATGALVADLLGIDQIIAIKGMMSDLIEKNKPKSWRVAASGDDTITYYAPAPATPFPGTVSWIAPDVTLTGLTEARTEETMRVSTGDKGGMVVFARLWWPGYHAFLDGAEVKVKAYRDVLVAVDVPAHSHAVLKLAFIAPGHRIYPWLVLAALLLFIPAGIFFSRKANTLDV